MITLSEQRPGIQTREALTALARLLEYPGPDFEQRLATATTAWVNGIPLLARFVQSMLGLSSEEREELYTATFDVTPSCVAYVSIHLFGEENFKRGAFMAALNARYAQSGFCPNEELPDHLSNLLSFAAGVENTECRELVQFCLLGPLAKMCRSLDESNPYRTLLELVQDTLQAIFPDIQPALSPLEQKQQQSAGCASLSAACCCGPALPVSADQDEPLLTT